MTPHQPPPPPPPTEDSDTNTIVLYITIAVSTSAILIFATALAAYYFTGSVPKNMPKAMDSKASAEGRPYIRLRL
jgi:hypothetical protein